MVYLLDANALIDANRDYYSLERVPEFWEWLAYHSQKGDVKVPIEIFEEVNDGDDDLAIWINDEKIGQDILYQTEADPFLVARCVEKGYANNLTDDEIGKLGRDPFLLGYALADPQQITIVTTEVSKPSKTRANKRLPDVAQSLGLRTLNVFQFTRELDFRTNWKEHLTG